MAHSMFPLCVRRRSGRYAVPDPGAMDVRHVWILLAIAAGWTYADLAADWNLSLTRVRQIHLKAIRSQKVLASQLIALGVL